MHFFFTTKRARHVYAPEHKTLSRSNNLTISYITCGSFSQNLMIISLWFQIHCVSSDDLWQNFIPNLTKMKNNIFGLFWIIFFYKKIFTGEISNPLTRQRTQYMCLNSVYWNLKKTLFRTNHLKYFEIVSTSYCRPRWSLEYYVCLRKAM